MTNFNLIFYGALLLTGAVTLCSSTLWKRLGCSSADYRAPKKAWTKVLTKYLVVYLLARLTDWLQGPFVYAILYKYQYSQQEISMLFLAGFGSSMAFGTFVGAMADQFGRRKFVVVFGLTYALSCLTKRTLWYSSRRELIASWR